MMGRMQNKKVYVNGTGKEVLALIGHSNESVDFMPSTLDRINSLDSKWFYQDNIPSVTFSKGRHLDYHKVSDDIEYINFKGMESIHLALFDWLIHLE